MTFLILIAGMVLQFVNINWGHWYHFTNDENALLIISGVLLLYIQNSTLKTSLDTFKTSMSVIKPLTDAVQIFNKLAQEAARSRGYNR